MATIFNQLHDVGGGPRGGVLVTVSLVWDNDLSPVARLTDDDVFVVEEYSVVTDGDGRWEADVVPNSSIEPTGSLYKILEGSYNPYFVDVTDSATPVFWVGDILADEPEWA